MNSSQFKALDLNLLKVFDALLEEHSVTSAAARLGLTPSAISHALSRLRHLLDDELFVRRSGGMQPTPRAAEIGPGIRQALWQLQSALGPSEFVPRTSDRQFTVACGEYVGGVLLPAMVARFRAEAPQAKLRVRPIRGTIVEDMDAGRVDLAIGGFERISDRFSSAPLFSDTMVWAISADHPFAQGPLTLEKLVELPHLIVAPEEDDYAVRGVVLDHGVERRVLRDDTDALEAALAKRGLHRQIRLIIPNGFTASVIAGGSDFAALLPKRMAIAYADRHRLKIFDAPYDAPPFDITALWHKRIGGDAAMIWLLGLFRDIATGV